MKLLQKTTEYGLYALVFLLPWQTRWIIKAGYTEYSTYSLYGTDILLIMLLLLLMIYVIASLPATPRNGRIIWWFIGGLVIVSAISIFFAASKPLTLFKFGWLVLGIGLFWLLSKVDYSRVKLIWSLLFGLVIQAMLAIWQFLLQATFANKWLGMSLHRAAELGASVVETIGADGIGERWLRAYGGFDHPNILGAVMAIGVLFLLNEIIVNQKEKNIFKIISWIFLVVFSAGLFFSFSRAAWLALSGGLIVAMAMAVVKKDYLAQKNILQAVLICGTIFFILFSQFPNLVLTRLYASDRLEIKSTSERVESIKNSWFIIKNNWASGIGMGNYTLALRDEVPRQINYFYQPVHNVFLLAWAEAGIFGLIFFTGVIFVIFKNDFKDVRRPLDIGRLGPILAALIILMSLDHWLWSLHFGILFFWTVLGIISQKNLTVQSPE